METDLWVSLERGKWKVHFENDPNGQVYLTQLVAIHEAKIIVSNSKEGEITAIWIYIGDGKLLKEWTYGEDPFPAVDNFVQLL
jgi:hypothetical protein